MHAIGGEDGFVKFLDEARADEAARARSRERWLQQQTTEQARFTGTLVELAEQDTPVNARVANGRVHQGRITAVGLDFCLVRAQVDAYLALHGLVWVQPTGAVIAPATGDRPAPLDMLMVEALHRLASDRPRIALFLRGDREPLAGQLHAVGLDVLTIRMHGDGRGTYFVPTAAVWEAVVARD
ncbi:MAG: hypothetical protein ACRD0K_14405 [Egibacteraceae bacterium]